MQILFSVVKHELTRVYICYSLIKICLSIGFRKCTIVVISVNKYDAKMQQDEPDEFME